MSFDYSKGRRVCNTLFLYELKGYRYILFCWCHDPPRTPQTLSTGQGPDLNRCPNRISGPRARTADRTIFFFLGLVSTQLAFRVQPKHTQVEAQYWGNQKVARLEGAIAILFWERLSHTQTYKQKRNRSVEVIEFWIFIIHYWCKAMDYWYNLCITSIRYFDCSHVSIEFQSIPVFGSWFVMPPHAYKWCAVIK